MTVRELIALLETMPPEATVLSHSDGDRQYSSPEEVVLSRPGGDVIIWGD